MFASVFINLDASGYRNHSFSILDNVDICYTPCAFIGIIKVFEQKCLQLVFFLTQSVNITTQLLVNSKKLMCTVEELFPYWTIQDSKIVAH